EIVDDVEASGKASETLGLEKSKSGENLGKFGLISSAGDNIDVEASTKATIVSVVDSIKATVLEINVVQDVTTFVKTSGKSDDVPNATSSVVQENLEN
ncbi:hypothetical protein A2U01_0073796, partial [Trifolium medium]|nr:hypothetical protein [Trifolium medium]